MTKLPVYLLWHQALNFMVTGEPRDSDPLLLDMEHAYAEAFGERPPVHCMSLDRARAALMDRLATGVAIAIGQKREAISVNCYETESLPSPIEPTAWVNLELDDATSFAKIDRLVVSIAGQGYANVRLRREDVLAARETVLAEQRAEQIQLAGLLAPIDALAPKPDTGESLRERRKRLEREAIEHLAASARDAIAAGDPLPGADSMWLAMPRPKVDRPRFRELHKAALVEHGARARGPGRIAS
jgi:hypothetical protein